MQQGENYMVIYDSNKRVFKLDTDNTSYVMGVTEEGYLGNIYYGKKVDTTDLVYAMRTGEYPFTPSVLPGEKISFMDKFPMEYPFDGTGDFHANCINIRNSAGQEGLELKVESHNIYAEKRKLDSIFLLLKHLEISMQKKESLQVCLLQGVKALCPLTLYFQTRFWVQKLF